MGAGAPHPMPFMLTSTTATQPNSLREFALISGAWYVQLKTGTTPDPGTAFKLSDILPTITLGDGTTTFPNHFMVQVESDNARWRPDGVDPTASVGFLLYELSAPTIVTDWPGLGNGITEAADNIRFIGVSANTVMNFCFFYAQ